jgi:hypothetical protein
MKPGFKGATQYLVIAAIAAFVILIGLGKALSSACDPFRTPSARGMAWNRCVGRTAKLFHPSPSTVQKPPIERIR